ncbi:riboflavin synthase subunit beta [Bizionia sp. M204]|uniref:riboflavin synthase subunit beta n=1 Tax=Bizionia sp. M204 TaxID=2675331 RepID=UPI00206E7BA9|nr:riboflavin synthase subunit beta [Bizionia sp. M204]UPS91609.1 riboflavin synthase subunit beta [Bizionia sp. M204]
MGVFSKRKNKKYSYTPRYYKGDENPYEIKHKFDDFRSTVGSSGGLKTKINTADDYKNNADEHANRRVLIIIAVLVFIFLLIIGFDLSIFLPEN